MKLAFGLGFIAGAYLTIMGILAWLSSELLVTPRHRDTRSMQAWKKDS